MGEVVVEVGGVILLVADEADGSLTYHPESLLYRFFEGLADGHYLAYALHAGSDLPRNPLEFGKVPAGYLADDIVEFGLEGFEGPSRREVLQLFQVIAYGNLGRYRGERVSGGLGGQCGGTGEAGVHLYHAVVHASVGGEGELHVAFADYAEMVHHLYRDSSQI